MYESLKKESHSVISEYQVGGGWVIKTAFIHPFSSRYVEIFESTQHD